VRRRQRRSRSRTAQAREVVVPLWDEEDEVEEEDDDYPLCERCQERIYEGSQGYKITMFQVDVTRGVEHTTQLMAGDRSRFICKDCHDNYYGEDPFRGDMMDCETCEYTSSIAVCHSCGSTVDDCPHCGAELWTW